MEYLQFMSVHVTFTIKADVSPLLKLFTAFIHIYSSVTKNLIEDEFTTH